MTAAVVGLDRDEETGDPWDLRLLGPAAGVWSGAAAGLLGVTVGVLTAALVVAVLLPVLLIRRRSVGRVTTRPTPRFGWFPAVAIGALTVSGWATAAVTVDRATTDPLAVAAESGQRIEITGTVAARPRSLGSGFGGAATWMVPIEVVSARVAGEEVVTSLRISVRSNDPDWGAMGIGTLVQAAGVGSIDTFPVVPGVLVRVRGSPVVLDTAPGWAAWTAVVAESVHRQAAALGGDPGALLPGLVLGDTSTVPDDLTDAARTTGLTHLLAVSGSHFSVVCGLVVVALRGAGPRVAAVGGLVTMAALVLLVGPQPSVVRAAVMAAVAMLALLTGRVRTALPALFTAVLVLILLDPTLALSFGFALSVLATGALVTLAPRWSRRLQGRGWPAGWADLVAIPVAAAVVTAPLVAVLSGSISVVAIPANIAVAPAVVPALLLGLAATVLGLWWPWGGQVAAELAAPPLEWIAFVAREFAQWPGAVVPWPASPVGALTLGAVLIAGCVLLRFRSARAAVTVLLCGALLGQLPALVLSADWPPPGWRMVLCEVGQGTAVVLATDDPTAVLLVDTGPDPAAVDRCLDDLGVHTVSLLVLTHLHADHVDGLTGVSDGRVIQAVLSGPIAGQELTHHRVQRELGAGPVRLTAAPGAVYQLPGLSLTVIGPRPGIGGAGAVNDASVVALVDQHGLRTLITGDIESAGQRSVLTSGTEVSADVLLQPHHGSAEVLPELLAAVGPQVTLIGVGLDNDYGHPAPSALALVGERGIAVGRTDLDGDVAVLSERQGLVLVRRGAGAG